ncbi:MAG TPA: hypothetical protein VHU80_15880 [Polyangiaceae bacterium]|nr:hypothetical protein [Polyangiaceae bacterium]
MAAGIFAGFTATAAAAGAASLPGAELEVALGPDAEGCPDADTLASELLQRIAPHSQEPAPLLLAVGIRRDGEDYEAHVHVEGRKSGERTLRARGPTCAALHDALVVTVLVLMDEDEDAAAPPAAASAPAPASGKEPVATAPTPNAVVVPEQRATERGPPPSVATRWRPSVWVAAGGGLTHGIPHAWSGVLQLDVAVRLSAFEVSAGGFWAPSRSILVPPGEIAVRTFGARVRGCYGWTPLQRGLRLLGCATGALADLTGESTHFDGSHGATRPWLLAGGSLEATYSLTSRIDAGVSLAALAALNKEKFSITAEPTLEAYTTDTVVAIAAARLEVRLF